MTLTLPSHLVETDWLEAHLLHPALRILDCTVFWESGPEGLRFESGRQAWKEGHIPGSAFVDLIEELSDPEARFPFMMPPAQRFAETMSRLGVSDDTAVVLYDGNMNIWAARTWWMLRAFGFDNAAVLNGGWRKWELKERAVSTEMPTCPAGNFVPRPRPGLIVGKQEVLAALHESQICLVNALSRESHRQQRIPGSLNVPAGSLLDPDTEAYWPLEVLRRRFEDAGVQMASRIITYCGVGIAAASDAFVLTLLGVEDVAVYDGSLAEWTADPELPLEQDTDSG